MNFEAAALAYVRHVLRERNQSISAFAKDAGISPSTLTRALNDPNHKFTLSMATIQKIALTSGLNPAPYLEAENVADLNTKWVSDPNLYDEKMWGKGANSPLSANPTLVVGDVEAGAWIEPSILPIERALPLLVTYIAAPPADCFACRVKGDSADLIAHPDEYLLCQRARRDALPNLQQAAVIVERRSKDQFKIELTARFIKRVRDHWELSSACSADRKGAKKKYFETISLETFGTDELTVLGIVEYVIRHPGR